MEKVSILEVCKLIFMTILVFSPRIFATTDDDYEYEDDETTNVSSTPVVTTFRTTFTSLNLAAPAQGDSGRSGPKDSMIPMVPKEVKNATRVICTQTSCGQTLFLTPYIMANDIDNAVKMSKVTGHPGLDDVRSYSGFLTVNNVSNSNIFFWFFPAMDSEISSPLIVWLQGGPGHSGQFGLFNLHGPFYIDEHMKVRRRNCTWAESLNVLYLDNPVGVGFSFTNDTNQGYVKSQDQVAEELYNALNQFFKLFRDYRDDHIYISGEGYGAKFAVSLAYKIHQMGKETIFNLKGITLGNPLLDMELLTDHAQHLHVLGLLNDRDLQAVDSRLQQAGYHIRHYAWTDAMNDIEAVFGSPYGRPVDKTAYIPQLNALPGDFNILEDEWPSHFQRYLQFVQQPEVRRCIHVGDRPFQDGSLAYNALREDIPQTVKNWLAILLDNYRVLFYGGNLDSKVPFSLSREVLLNIKWKHLDDYKNSKRLIWKLDQRDRDVAGYVHHVKNFFEVMIRNAGHAVAYDQPKAALDMINRFIWGRAFIVSQRF